MGDSKKLMALAKKKKKTEMIKQGKLLMGKFTQHRDWPLELWELVLRALPLSFVTTSGEASSGQKSKLMTLLLETNRMPTLPDTMAYRERVCAVHLVLDEVYHDGKLVLFRLLIRV